MLPNLDAQLVPYSRNRAGQSAHRPQTAPSALQAPSASTSPSAHGGLLGDVINTSDSQDDDDTPAQSQLPTQLPLVSEFSLSTIDHGQVLQETAKQGTERSMVSEQRWQDHMPVQHEQPHAQQDDVSIVNARHKRVSVNTAGTVKRSVFTVAQHQASMQPEGPHASQHGHVTGLLSPAASASASHQEEEDLGPSHSTEFLPHGHAPSPHALHQGNALLDIPSLGLYQSSISIDTNQKRSVNSSRSSCPSPALHDRALQNSSSINAGASPTSPARQGKALANSPASQAGHPLRRSGDAEHVIQSQEAVQQAALLAAVHEVHPAQGDASVPALQALQLQIGGAMDTVLQACLPQVRISGTQSHCITPGTTSLRTIISTESPDSIIGVIWNTSHIACYNHR